MDTDTCYRYRKMFFFQNCVPFLANMKGFSLYGDVLSNLTQTLYHLHVNFINLHQLDIDIEVLSLLAKWADNIKHRQNLPAKGINN